MLDVHPPHTKMHGFGDFLLHLLTITVGLFIALALEGCVERVHQHHLRDEAEANLRQEIRDNEKELAETRVAIAKEKVMLVKVLAFMQARAARKPYDIHAVSLGFTIATLNDASWKTASATGALTYMDYAQVKRFAGTYQLQEQWSNIQAQTLQDFLQLESYVVYGFDPAKLSQADADAGAHDLRRALAHLLALDQIGAGMEKTYNEVLRER